MSRLKTRLFFAFLAQLSCGLVFAASYDAKEVSSEELAAALSSSPVEDKTAELIRIGSECAGMWIARGEIAGKTLFHEDFSGGGSSTVKWDDGNGGVPCARIIPDGRGGSCLELSPVDGTWSNFVLKDGFSVPVSTNRPFAVLWEARSPHGGNSVWLRIDFLDRNRKRLNASYQMRSTLDPTQPHLFQRNMTVLNLRMPSEARYVRPYFFLGRKEVDKQSGEIANVRIMEYVEAMEAAQSASRRVIAEREISPDDVLVYCDDNLISSFPILPHGTSLPGCAGDALKVRECPGEKTRATAILWSRTAWRDVSVEFSSCCGGDGPGIPASAFSAKVVKAHYQAEGAPHGFLALSDRQVLVPELLLNDDKLVVPDHVRGRNLVKYRNGSRSWYVDINTVKAQKWGFPIPAESMPIYDAKTLQPFDLPEKRNFQLAIRIAVPERAPAGVYRGKVSFKSGGREIAKLPVELEVLPFKLPKRAETIYDPRREYSMGLYVWATVNREDKAVFRPFLRSRAQVLEEWRTLRDNGLTHPIFVWFSDLVYNDVEFRKHLALVREAGYDGDKLHFGGSGLIGNDTDAGKLEAMQARMTHAMKVAREYGFEELYFYGFDEAVGDRLLSQLPAWKAAREVGAKVIVSGFSQFFDLIGGKLDICVLNDDPANADAARWHAKGTMLWKYNTPQSGPEDPGVFRRNYGLDLWRRGFDGASTYCDVSGNTVWNDVAKAQERRALGKTGGDVYRAQCMVYPTVDGVVETLALTGLESAIKDVRVMTKLRQLLRERSDQEAEKWMNTIDYRMAEPADVRKAAIEHILRLVERDADTLKRKEHK